MAQKFTSLYKKDPIAAELEAGIQATDVYQGSPYALANIPEFEGVQYATPNYKRYEDLYGLYMGGGFDATQPDFVTPPADTTPINTPVAIGGGGGGNIVDQLGTVDQGGTGINTPFEQNLIDQGVGVQIAPGQPVMDPGSGLYTQEDLDAFNQRPVTPANLNDPTTMIPQIPEVGPEEPPTNVMGPFNYMQPEETKQIARTDDISNLAYEYFNQEEPPTNVMGPFDYMQPKETLADTTWNKMDDDIDIPETTLGDVFTTEAQADEFTAERPPMLGEEGLSMDDMSGALDAPYGVNPNTGIPYQTPRTIADQKRILGQTFEEKDTTKLEKFRDNFVETGEDIGNFFTNLTNEGIDVSNLVGTTILNYLGNSIASVPLLGTMLSAAEPDKYNKEAQGALDEIDMLKTTQGGLTVDKYGKNVQSILGDYDDYNLERQIDLQEKIDDGTIQEFKEDGSLTYLAQELEDRKKIEKKLNETRLEGAKEEQQDFVQEIEAQPAVQSGSGEAREQQRDTGVASVQTDQGTRYETSSGDRYASAEEAAEKGDGGSGGGGGKIGCTMMNDSYGFGSFRNKIWLRHSKDLAPEYQIGYHKIFLPLVKLSKTNKLLKKTLEHIAVHRTIDIRQEERGKKHLLGRIYRKVLEPICYIVGKYAKK